MRFRSAVCSVILIGALTSRAFAAPAVIKVFEAKVHQAPSADSPVLETLPEDAKVSVSEDVTDGWRRVRLSDGRTAFIRDAEVAVTSPIPVQPLQAATTPQPPPAKRQAVIYVKNLSHLAELVEGDTVVHPKAQALVNRQTTAYIVGIASGVVGLTLMIVSLTALAGQTCFGPDDCVKDPNKPALFGGVALLGLSWPIGMVIWPRRDAILDVINEWNTRHTDQPFTLEHQPAFGP
jgi:hypothetical protein